MVQYICISGLVASSADSTNTWQVGAKSRFWIVLWETDQSRSEIVQRNWEVLIFHIHYNWNLADHFRNIICSFMLVGLSMCVLSVLVLLIWMSSSASAGCVSLWMSSSLSINIWCNTWPGLFCTLHPACNMHHSFISCSILWWTYSIFIYFHHNGDLWCTVAVDWNSGLPHVVCD